MLTIVRCENDLVEDDLLDEARDVLNQFQNLNLIFDNFKDPSFNDKNNANIVFKICMNSSLNRDYLSYLRRLELALTNLIYHGKLYIRDRERINKKFINRMTSSSPSDFSPAISEILVADNLLSLFGPDNFQYEEGKKSESKPDFRITSKGKTYNLELKTLMKGTTKEKIETIFNEVCMSFLSELKDNGNLKCNIIIRLDTAKLCIDEEKRIDTEASKKYLFSYFDKRALLNAVGNDATINFEDIRGVKFQEEDLERRASEVFRNESHPALIETSKQKDNRIDNHIVEWLDKIKIKDLVLCPFDTLIVRRSMEASCVSISPIDINMEDEHSTIPGFSSSTMSKNSYIHQIQDALKRKDDLRHRKKNEPAIIILDTFDWHFNYFDYDEFVKLKRLLEEELKEYTDISGIILFHEISFGSKYNELYDGRYIENKYCDTSKKNYNHYILLRNMRMFR
jgi:hypothetical protein